MEWSENALILRVGKFKEADQWVRMLTPSHGLITGFAFGGSKSRRRFTGCLDIFNLVLTRISTSKDGKFLNLEEATLLGSMPKLRSSWQKQGMAANCIRFLESLGVSAEDGDKIFAITCSMLKLFENAEECMPMWPLLFRFRLAAEQGYVPQLSNCSFCDAPLDAGGYFLIAEGTCACHKCNPLASMGLRMSKQTFSTLVKVQENSPESWWEYTLESEDWREIARFVDNFIGYHLGMEWNNGSFRRTT